MKASIDELVYELDEGWGTPPPDKPLAEVTGVAVDSRDRVYVFNRGAHPVMVFERDGRFVNTWGAGLFKHPHGIFISPEDVVYCVDDGAHSVLQCTTDGQVLATISTLESPSDTGYDGSRYQTIVRGGPPFNRPTNVALASTGELFVADGYGNSRVHKFAHDGKHLLSWGEPGNGPGQFRIPHGICVDRTGAVLIADRENHRVQRFTANGEFVSEWAGIHRPADLKFDAAGNLFVAGASPGWANGAKKAGEPSQVTVLSSDGTALARWGSDDPFAPGSFLAAHGLWLDSHGDVYVGEVVTSATKGDVTPETCHVIQKFVKRA